MGYTKLEAIKELLHHDHAFLSPEGVKRIGEPFGVYRTYKAKDTRSKHKGLTLYGMKEGDVAEGLDAHILAMMICEKEKVEYPQFFGIGSQLRGCCQAMIDHLTKGDEHEKT